MSENNGLYVGIDLGTSAVKVIAADAKGRIIAEASESYGVFYLQKGWSEQNPEDWFSATLNPSKD